MRGFPLPQDHLSRFCSAESALANSDTRWSAAWLWLSGSEPGEIENPSGRLTAVIGRVSLDMLCFHAVRHAEPLRPHRAQHDSRTVSSARGRRGRTGGRRAAGQAAGERDRERQRGEAGDDRAVAERRPHADGGEDHDADRPGLGGSGEGARQRDRLAGDGGQRPGHNVAMRGASDRHRSDRHRIPEGQGLRRQQVRLSRGHWREEGPGAIRSAGWWESVTVTWSSAPGPERPERRPAALQRALAATADMIAPLLTDIAVTSARRLLAGRHRARPPLSLSWRRLPSAARELPRSGRTP